ncbi:MAG TPA: alpha-amylase family glycosyl hydrolase [Acidobacteriaceae bacterium]|nr:alpha-amylase family glycosyl hydrolase [Acidobacteriaceae bacterium]
MKANPALYQVDARDWLYRVTEKIGRPATLDDISDADLDHLAALGFDWIWPLGIWQTGDAGVGVSRSMEAWQQSFVEAIPDLQPEDIAGSIFAIRGYQIHKDYGGAEALARLRQRLLARGMRLMLDFVPNHTAIDHPWARNHPEYYMSASESEADAGNYIRVDTDRGPMTLAHGRDPNFPGWPDTLQLNYGNPDLQRAMIAELQHIATMCDGVRCDMAMLELPDVFRRTWNIDIEDFWPRAIAAAKAVSNDFVLMAEVYWGLEWRLQQLGFDYTYDKELYDRLRHGDAASVRGHLTASPDYQRKSVRFLENHDEPRAAQVFDPDKYKAAAMITYFVPGMRFFHDGQLQGCQHKPSPHLRRRFCGPPDENLKEFYDGLLQLLRGEIYQSEWRLLDVESPLICFAWQNKQGTLSIIAVNYSPHPSSGKAKLPPSTLPTAKLTTQISSAKTDRAAPLEIYLPLDLPPWGYRVITSASSS